MLKYLFLLILLPFTANAAFFDRKPPETSQQLILSYATLVKKAAPAVVNIYTRNKVLVQPLSPLFQDPLFQQFFGQGLIGKPRERIENSLGSGVIIKSEGLIVTNYHVVKESTEIKAVLMDGREFDATIVAKDKKMDLALLKINPKESLPIIELENSDNVEVGDLVLAIGNPFGVGQTVTHGIVSALGRTAAGLSGYQSFIQTDAAINPGNSGGALIGMNGRLIGINTAIYSRSGGSIGVGFATPSNVVALIMNSLAHGGKIIRPWFGASMQRVTQDIANAIGLAAPRGGIVGVIYPSGPASQAGLQEGDVVLKIDQHEVQDEHDFEFRIATYETGKTAQLSVWRRGEMLIIPLAMVPPPETPAPDTRTLSGNQPLAGASIANLSPALADSMEMPLMKKGVVITEIAPGSTSQRIGFKRGDIILQMNATAVTSTKQLESLLNDPELPYWRLSFERAGKRITLQVRE